MIKYYLTTGSSFPFGRCDGPWVSNKVSKFCFMESNSLWLILLAILDLITRHMTKIGINLDDMFFKSQRFSWISVKLNFNMRNLVLQYTYNNDNLCQLCKITQHPSITFEIWYTCVIDLLDQIWLFLFLKNSSDKNV